jgi:hypothetical protein
MPFPFDATLKDLATRHAADFAAAFGLGVSPPPHVENVDLSTVSAATDVVLAFGDPPESVVDLNFQAGRKAALDELLLLYNGLLRWRLHAPVHSVVVSLRAAADHPALTGRLTYAGRPRRGKIDFRYEVVRMWRRPVRRLLAGGIGTLPLALLGQLPAGVSAEEGLPDVIRRIERRVRREAAADEAAHLLTSAFVLSGLRVSKETAVELFRGVPAVEESTTYQYILEQGGVRTARRILLAQGRDLFGPPDEATATRLNGISDLERLERMARRVPQASGWRDLLETP